MPMFTDIDPLHALMLESYLRSSCCYPLLSRGGLSFSAPPCGSVLLDMVMSCKRGTFSHGYNAPWDTEMSIYRLPLSPAIYRLPLSPADQRKLQRDLSILCTDECTCKKGPA